MFHRQNMFLCPVTFLVRGSKNWFVENKIKLFLFLSTRFYNFAESVKVPFWLPNKKRHPELCNKTKTLQNHCAKALYFEHHKGTLLEGLKFYLENNYHPRAIQQNCWKESLFPYSSQPPGRRLQQWRRSK